MRTTLSPQSTCGVNEFLCLPLRRSATKEASRPRTTPSASTRIHFLPFAAAAGVNETVDMSSSQIRIGGPELGARRRSRNIHRGDAQVNRENALQIRQFEVR